jgi:hypothetical protein
MYCMNKNQDKLTCMNVILIANLNQNMFHTFGDKIPLLTNTISSYCIRLI